MKTISALSLSLLLGVSAVTSATAQASQNVSWQRVVWQHIPINISLPVGQQRIIRVPNSAKIGLPASVANDIKSERFNGWFYLTATRAFKPVQAQIVDNTTGKTILLNISATQHAPDSALSIVYPQTAPSAPQNFNEAQDSSGTQNDGLQGSMAIATLIQYAEHQMYAPKRLRKEHPGIQLIASYPDQNGNVPQNEWVYGLFTDHSVVGMPWLQIHGGDYYLTAVVIKNLLPIRINLVNNLVNLCGRYSGTWDAVSFFPYQKGHIWQIAKQGTPYDSTVAFLVSKEPFAEAIRDCKGGEGNG